MLSADADVAVLDPVRVAGFEEAKTEVIGEKENAMFTSAGLGLGIMGTYVWRKGDPSRAAKCVYSCGRPRLGGAGEGQGKTGRPGSLYLDQ